MKSKVPRRRNGVYYINGKEYASVTKVIGDTLAKPALLYWYGKKAAEIALKNPELNEKEVMAELRLFSKSTQERGKYVHAIAEAMPDVKDLIDPSRPELDGYIHALQAFWDTHQPKLLGQEIELYTDTYGVAGRCDQVCEINGKKWLIDYKTGKAIYHEVDLQLAIYDFMLNEMGVVKVDYTGVVLLKDDGSFVFQRTNGTLQDFLNVLEVWKWIKRKD